MTLRNILVPILPSVDADVQLAAALDIARQVEAHINAVFIRPDPLDIFASSPALSIAAGVTLAALEQEGRGTEAAAQAHFDQWRLEHELACEMVGSSLRTPYACWSARIGTIEPIVARRGRLSDLIVLNLPSSKQTRTEKAFDAAVFETGRPVILLPKTVPSNLNRHVLIAWNGSLEATRAVAGAMTLLHEAEEVSIFITNDVGAPAEDLDLAEFLTWHGIKARYYRPHSDDEPTGAAVLRIAKERDVTMLVMGAYTHSRITQMLLGGVTSHVLNHAEIPVLMAH